MNPPSYVDGAPEFAEVCRRGRASPDRSFLSYVVISESMTTPCWMYSRMLEAPHKPRFWKQQAAHEWRYQTTIGLKASYGMTPSSYQRKQEMRQEKTNK